MKKIMLVALLLALPASSFAASPYVGKLDLDSIPTPIVQRDLNSGLWLAGFQDQIWELDYAPTKHQILYVAPFVSTRLEGQDAAFGASINTRLGQTAYSLVNLGLELAQAADQTPPPFLEKFDQYASAGVFGGYRPSTSGGDKHGVYGFQFQLTAPFTFGDLLTWAKGGSAPGL